MTNKLITTTSAFNQEYIRHGHLVIVKNASNSVIGTGVILETNPLELTIAFYSASDDRTMDIYPEIMERVIKYRINIDDVESGKVSLVIINPLEVS